MRLFGCVGAVSEMGKREGVWEESVVCVHFVFLFLFDAERGGG